MLGIIELGVLGSLLSIVYRYHRAMSRSMHVVSLLEAGQPEAFLEAIEEDIRTARNKRVRYCLLVNKSAGLSYLGRHEEAVQLLESVPLRDLPGLFKQLYCNNLLVMLLHLGHFEAATTLYQQQRQRLEKPTRNRKMNSYLQGTVAAYQLMCGDRALGRTTLESLLQQPASDMAQATRWYFLGLAEGQDGHLQSALEKLERAAQLAPRSHLPQTVARWRQDRGL